MTTEEEIQYKDAQIANMEMTIRDLKKEKDSITHIAYQAGRDYEKTCKLCVREPEIAKVSPFPLECGECSRFYSDLWEMKK